MILFSEKTNVLYTSADTENKPKQWKLNQPRMYKNSWIPASLERIRLLVPEIWHWQSSLMLRLTQTQKLTSVYAKSLSPFATPSTALTCHNFWYNVIRRLSIVNITSRLRFLELPNGLLPDLTDSCNPLSILKANLHECDLTFTVLECW